MIAIIDYGMGNLSSVKKAIDYIGFDAVITSDPKVVLGADGVILPGVGAISFAMEALKENKLDEAVKEYVKSGKPFMGICLGMQMLFDESEESSTGTNVKGLGLIKGTVRKFPSKETVEEGLKVPQIGWNSLTNVNCPYLSEDSYVYFVHSFYCDPEDKSDVAAETEYGIKYCCAVMHDNVFATQFHPEKSGEVGLNILKKFAGRTRQ